MKVLVTGGGGFLGRRIVELLVTTGHEVSFLSRRRYPQVEACGARGLQVDLGDAEAVRDAVRGMDIVIHVAAKAEPWGAFEDYRLGGTAFSGPALGVLRALLDEQRLEDEATLEELKEKSGLSAREFREFLASLKGDGA